MCEGFIDYMLQVHILWFPFFLQKAMEETENQVSGRYNLRRRKDQGEEQPLEQKNTQPIVSLATPQQTSKTTDLEFGGRIGKKPIILF